MSQLLIDDPVYLARTARSWRIVRARRLAAEAAERAKQASIEQAPKETARRAAKRKAGASRA